MRITKFSLGLSLIFVAVSLANAQDTNTDTHTVGITIPEVALVDIEPAATKNITLGFTAPTEAGLPITPTGSNNTLWLNYSSIKSATDATRNVSVRLNALIPGIDIRVTAAAATGAGGGTLGTSAGQITLSAADQTIISGIGSAYTGDGANNGHNLTYALAPGSGTGTVASYADLESTTTAVATVTYTISDN
ncbi:MULTISPECIES: hypothetical protein [Chryseobacterium]|uniref:Uncharacterized protein n=1 Tax=Chryseobacterium camelliae TaxID=1265445 RepID=A0ABU0TLG4_9FLAO|nr:MULTISPECIES: hypothetical protein [Chryseobacterium]MDT3408262.1 hypothetical protein [Pseudacidovorax intermedius]MDQ1097883.1 hypothetical protein [Chryseobacterium camelliae]MDQ1101817.1 hypothetical protein [Chryseobacterium sp. SORGH_AS_1048]MDR6085255.1 hypothetical protein [Chryseobacterium sp. SORGH_AS_0909]MDR6129614.1 hypothetical protein [Chryseobacterium sp. SORGH_AS_1175]